VRCIALLYGRLLPVITALRGTDLAQTVLHQLLLGIDCTYMVAYSSTHALLESPELGSLLACLFQQLNRCCCVVFYMHP